MSYVWHLSGQGRQWEVLYDLGDAWLVVWCQECYVLPKAEFVEVRDHFIFNKQ